MLASFKNHQNVFLVLAVAFVVAPVSYNHAAKASTVATEIRSLGQ